MKTMEMKKGSVKQAKKNILQIIFMYRSFNIYHISMFALRI